MMAWRPNPIRSAGLEHHRYRSAATTALGQVYLHGLHAIVERISVALIPGPISNAHHHLPVLHDRELKFVACESDAHRFAVARS